MNKGQNNKTLAVYRTSPLTRVWRTADVPGTPLVCHWVIPDAAAAAVGIKTGEQKSNNSGGLLLCA